MLADNPFVIMMPIDADSDTNEAEADISGVFELNLRFVRGVCGLFVHCCAQ